MHLDTWTQTVKSQTQLLYKHQIITQSMLKNHLITFCVSRTWCKMYTGHSHLCVCLSPHSHTTARTRM